MRIKSHWFRPGTPKGATDVAGAAAFIAFRVAQNALKNMRKADYALPPGAPYFAFLAEFLAFLVLGADRIAHARGDEAWRVEFTTAMANKVGEFLADNEADLLGGDTKDAYKRRFIALVNERAGAYDAFGWTAEGPDYAFLRCLGHLAAETVESRERTWAVSQVIEVEAPEAAEMLQRAMSGLLDPSPRRRERSAAGSRGE